MNAFRRMDGRTGESEGRSGISLGSGISSFSRSVSRQSRRRRLSFASFRIPNTDDATTTTTVQKGGGEKLGK